MFLSGPRRPEQQGRWRQSSSVREHWRDVSLADFSSLSADFLSEVLPVLLAFILRLLYRMPFFLTERFASLSVGAYLYRLKQSRYQDGRL